MTTWLMALLFACGGDEKGAEEEDARPVTVVETQVVERGSVVERIATTAVVEAERSADLVPVNPGTVLSVHADDGDAVQRGDLLAVLENVALQAGADRSRAEVARLEAQLRDSERLHAQGAISQRDLDDLRYQVQSARVNAREAGRSYGQTRLTAPFDGVVGRRDVKVGELATGSTVAFQIVDLESLLVRADLPERDMGRVRTGQTARLVSAYDEELRGTGIVERVAPVIDPSSGTFRVTVDLGPDEPLRPGQFVKVELEVDRHEDVLVVPRKAVLWEDGRAHVFVMAPSEEEGAGPDDRVADRRLLEPGLMDDLSMEVLGGIEVGDEVIVVGQSNLKEGARVRPANEGVKAVPEQGG